MNSRALRMGSAALLAVAAMACGGDASDSVEESPEAVPGMEGSLEPSVGTGVTETTS